MRSVEVLRGVVTAAAAGAVVGVIIALASGSRGSTDRAGGDMEELDDCIDGLTEEYDSIGGVL